MSCPVQSTARSPTENTGGVVLEAVLSSTGRDITGQVHHRRGPDGEGNQALRRTQSAPLQPIPPPHHYTVLLLVRIAPLQGGTGAAPVGVTEGSSEQSEDLRGKPALTQE